MFERIENSKYISKCARLSRSERSTVICSGPLMRRSIFALPKKKKVTEVVKDDALFE